MITVDEVVARARPLIERLAREVAARAIEQAMAQLEHDLEALVAERITPDDVLADPVPRRSRAAAATEPKAARPCGCSATGRHRRTCSLAGKAATPTRAVEPEPEPEPELEPDDDDEEPTPAVKRATARVDRFARIEERAAQRRGEVR